MSKDINQSICVYNPVNCFLEKVYMDSDLEFLDNNNYIECIEEILEESL